MNKKAYITPALVTTHVAQCLPIASSTLEFDSDKTVSGNDDIGTKDRGDWNIWE